MTDWQPLRVTLSIYEVEGDNQYFDPGRYTATVKLNTGANIQLDLGDPENSGSLYLKDQYDTLRISLKEKNTEQVYGAVSFDAEMFRDSPVAKQWITLNNSALSDVFQGEIGRDERNTPRIYLGYDAIPQAEGENRGRTTAKRTKETSQLDRGSHDSRRKKSARGNVRGGKLVVKQNKSRVVSQRNMRSTKTTKVEKKKVGSLKGSQLGGSLRGSASRISNRAADRVSASRRNEEVKESRRIEDEGGDSRRGGNYNNSYRGEKVTTKITSRRVGGDNFSASGAGSTSGRSIKKKTTTNFSSSVRSPKSGGLEHDLVEREIDAKTKILADDIIKEKSTIRVEEEQLINRLKTFNGSSLNLDRDEKELMILKNKAEQDLENIKTEAISIQREEQRSQEDLLRQLELLEQEHQDIEVELEDEQMVASRTGGGKVTIGGVESREVEEINNIKQETQMVLDEVKDAVRNNQIPLEESSFDPLFREDLDRHANDILEKENQRYEIELEGSGMGEASLNYQRNQKEALQKEYDRVTIMYDSLADDMDKELNDEIQELEQLKDYHRKLEEDRDHFRYQIDGYKNDQSMTYSLDAGSGPVNKFGQSSNNPFGGNRDDEIKRKIDECEDAEKSRREAEITLDRLYDQWRSQIDRELDGAYVKLTSDSSERVSKQELSSLMINSDKVTRSLNALLSDKERLENLLYLRKTNFRLTNIVSFDNKSMSGRLTSIKKEDKELMDELNKSDNALLSKNTALRELDDKIRILSRKYADLEAEAQEKKGLISSLRIKHDHVRIEIERLRGLIDKDELARMEAEIRTKEHRLRDL